MQDFNWAIISTLTLITPGIHAFHDASCIMSVPERSVPNMPENAVVTNEIDEKLIALPTIHEIIEPHTHDVVTIIPLTHKAVILILPSRKRKFLSEVDNTVASYRGDQANVPRRTMTGSASRKPRLVGGIEGCNIIKLLFTGKPHPVGGELHYSVSY